MVYCVQARFFIRRLPESGREKRLELGAADLCGCWVAVAESVACWFGVFGWVGDGTASGRTGLPRMAPERQSFTET